MIVFIKTMKDDEIVMWNILGRIAIITDFQCCNFIHCMTGTCSGLNFFSVIMSPKLLFLEHNQGHYWQYVYITRISTVKIKLF